MKICLIANPNSAHTRRFVQGLLARDFSVTLIGEHAPQNPFVVDRTVQDRFSFIDLTHLLNLRRVRFLVWGCYMPQVIRRIQPCVVHALSASGAAWLGAASFHHPFVITATGSDLLLLPQKSFTHRQLTTWALGKADEVLCVSNQLTQAAMALHIPNEKLSTISMSVDFKTFSPIEAGSSSSNTHAASPDTLTVISLRALKPIYNPLDIARATPLIIEGAPKTRFFILTYHSDPKILTQFQAIISASDAEGSVYYLQKMTNDQEIAETLQKSDIAISIAASDGTPVSVLESMACGNALILGDLPTFHPWVRHEENALFVPLGDVNALSQAVLRLINDTELRRKLSTNAVATAQEKANLERQFDQVRDIYMRYE